MKNLITGLIIASLAWGAAFAEPAEPAPTAPQPTTTTPVTQPAPPVVEDQSQVKSDQPTVQTEPAQTIAEREKPRKKKRPLEIKWIDF